MPHILDVRLTRCFQYLLLLVVGILYADMSAAQTLSKLGSKKRGGGWGYTAPDVSGELEAMPVQWWYNWGNGIPDPAAQAVTAVTFILHVNSELYMKLKCPRIFLICAMLTCPILCTGKRDRLRSHDIRELLRL